jgi:hypothetical protein
LLRMFSVEFENKFYRKIIFGRPDRATFAKIVSLIT